MSKSKSNNFDSVFTSYNDEDIEFDTIFDQEDELVDTVNGVNESGIPLTETDVPMAGVKDSDLHQTDEDTTISQFRDQVQDDTEYPSNAEGTTDEDIEDELLNRTDDSEAGEFYDNAEGTTDEDIEDELLNRTDDSEAGEFYDNAEEEYQDNEDLGPQNQQINNLDDEIDQIAAEAAAENFYNNSDKDYQEGKDKGTTKNVDPSELLKQIDKYACSESADIDDILGSYNETDDPEIEDDEDVDAILDSDSDGVENEGCHKENTDASGEDAGGDEEENIEESSDPLNSLLEEFLTEGKKEKDPTVDKDVQDIEDAESEDYDLDIDALLDKEKTNSKSAGLDYDPSDEELIDLVLNDKI